MLTNSIINDIKHWLRYGNAITRFIIINAIVFIVVALFNLGCFLFQSHDFYTTVLYKLEVPASLSSLAHQPWSVFTYMFLHEGFFHVLFNMLWLYWFGEILVLYMGDKKVPLLYIFGGLTGALFYIAAYNLVPVFKADVNVVTMLGASASVFAIAFAAVALNPDHEIGLLLFGPVRIKYVAIVMLLLDIIAIPNGNAGGYIAHLGGALFGYFYIKALRGGVDVGSPFASLFSSIGSLFKRKPKVKVTYKSTVTAQPGKAPRSSNDQERIDAILDKISRSGYDSLSKEERDFLFNYSKK